MSLAPPYIPRSIRQVDQSTTEPNMSEIPQPSSTVHTNTDNRFRIQDVNLWLNNFQQNQPMNDGEFPNQPEHERDGDGAGVGGGAGEASEQQLPLEPLNQFLLPEHPQLDDERRMNQTMDEEGVKEENQNNNQQQQESKLDRSTRVTIEYSSPPLPVEIVSGDHSVVDGPIVLGGDRLLSVGSRPNSARPMSAKKVMVSVCILIVFSLQL